MQAFVPLGTTYIYKDLTYNTEKLIIILSLHISLKIFIFISACDTSHFCF